MGHATYGYHTVEKKQNISSFEKEQSKKSRIRSHFDRIGEIISDRIFFKVHWIPPSISKKECTLELFIADLVWPIFQGNRIGTT